VEEGLGVGGTAPPPPTSDQDQDPGQQETGRKKSWSHLQSLFQSYMIALFTVTQLLNNVD
jgi:hypothetical protein